MESARNRETFQKILDAALALWSEKGYAQATMRELAQRVRMGVSSLYFYFESKEAIVQYLYQILNERSRERFRAGDQGEKDLGQNFKRFLEIKLDALEPHRSAMAAILKEAVDPESKLSPMGPDSSKVLQENVEFFQELAQRAQPKNPATLARLLWLGHMAVLLYWLHDRSPQSHNTRLLLGKIAGVAKWMPMLSKLPGAKELSSLFAALVPQAAPAKAAVAAETEAPAKEFDVVVIGAGPIGCLYASFLKLQRPKTRILVLERAPEPGHKIGESTLSGFCKALRSVGIRPEALETLFYPKSGLGFLHVDETVRDLAKAPEYILETFDRTFQVERRVLDSLLIANAQRLGISVVQGAAVQIEKSSFGAAGNVLIYSVGAREYRLRAALVVDASGPAGVLPNHFGLRTAEGLPFQTSSVWTYFTGIRPLAQYSGWLKKSQAPRDHYTGHLCFREGWLWHIPLVSWQSAPTANLGRALDRVLRAGRGVPTREELSEEFACPAQDIVSIGLTVRSDRDKLMNDDPWGAFQHYLQKYPAIAQLLEGAKRLESYYGPTHMSRLHFRGYSRQVAGDGWLLVGDAAFFVDPLISPGLTGGTAGAYQAALVSAKALEAGKFSREFFSGYESFIHRLHEALERDNQLVYMSFNHPEAIALVQRFQEIDARRHFLANRSNDYGLEDTNVWGILEPEYQKAQRAAWDILWEEEQSVGKRLSVQEQSVRDYEPMVQRLSKLLSPYVQSHADLTPYVKANAG